MKIGFAFSGKIASGKSYIAHKISKSIGCNVFSFATPIKQLSKTLEDNFPEIKTEGSEKNRKLLNVIGQGVKNILSDDIWIKTLLSKSSEHSIVIVDDLRFVSEFKSLKTDKNRKWFFINIDTPELTRINRIKKIYPNSYMDHINSSIKPEIPIPAFDLNSSNIQDIINYVLNKIGASDFRGVQK
jgi:dephospho-CoA kinase